MTEDHLTDEELSAHLDGEPGDSHPVAEHLARCGACRAQMADLESARALVRTPVPPVPPDVRAASIATVLRRAGDEPGDVTIPVTTPAATPVTTPATIPIRSRGPHVVGAAAAVLVLTVAIWVPLAVSSTSSTSRPSTASPARASAGATGPVPGRHQRSARSQSSGADGLSQDTTAVRDMGAIGSVSMLRSRVADFSVAGTGAQPPVTVPVATSSARATGTTPTFERCLAAAGRAVTGPQRPVTLLATADYRRRPALVYVFGPVAGSTTGKEARAVAVVVARTVATTSSTCRVLITTTL